MVMFSILRLWVCKERRRPTILAPSTPSRYSMRKPGRFC